MELIDFARGQKARQTRQEEALGEVTRGAENQQRFDRCVAVLSAHMDTLPRMAQGIGNLEC
ncbi:hypothetical protein GCM10027027_04670 [Neomicrococcus lactis]